jgi:RNA polymerase sigma-70 factor (ECF subfamily)
MPAPQEHRRLMNGTQQTERFVQHLTECQHRLYAYILSLWPNPAGARDILQQTNLTLWRKASQLAEDANFDAWACKVAYYEVLGARRDRSRDRHLFDDRLLGELASDAQRQMTDTDERLSALEDCVTRLSTKQRDLVADRYRVGLSVKEIADKCGLKSGTVATSLHRIRRSLMQCIENRLAARSPS